jgi:hypothetical protein
MPMRWALAGGAVAVVAVGVTLLLTSGSSDSGFRDTALGVAHDALSAVRTVDVLSTADQNGSLLPTYRSRAAHDAATGLTDAVRELESADRPGPGSVSLYERLDPLLRTAVAAVGDTESAMARQDMGQLATAKSRLRATGDGLAEFVRSTR